MLDLLEEMFLNRRRTTITLVSVTLFGLLLWFLFDHEGMQRVFQNFVMFIVGNVLFALKLALVPAILFVAIRWMLTGRKPFSGKGAPKKH